MTVETLTITAQLAELRTEQCLDQYRAALALSVHPNSVSNWDRAVVSPLVRHVVAYARLLGRRIVARRDGLTIGDLVDVLAMLGQPIGPYTCLADAERYLRARGYTVELADISAEPVYGLLVSPMFQGGPL